MAFKNIAPVTYSCNCSWCKGTFKGQKKSDFLCSEECEQQWEIKHVYFMFLVEDGFFKRWQDFSNKNGAGISLELGWWRSRLAEDYPHRIGGKVSTQEKADSNRHMYEKFDAVFEQNKFFITQYPPYATPAEFDALPMQVKNIFKRPSGPDEKVIKVKPIVKPVLQTLDLFDDVLSSYG